MYDFKGKVAIVTGAGIGIGKAVLMQLARDGATVVSVDLNGENAERVAAAARALGAVALSYAVDVSDEAAVHRMVADVEEKLGRVDILVNNAGLWRCDQGPFVESQSASWKKKINVNILGTMYVTKAVLGGMIDRKYGRIVNLASVAGVYGNKNMVDYSTTKAAIIGFTKALAKEMGEFGITVNAVSPGSINSEEEYRNNTELSFLGRSGSSDECANVITFLCSDAASYVSGQNYLVDGCRKKM
ncbi:MAG: SDR family oxidoreductase [Ruminococcaceae bacterium]|nr:SDR family oxidoreductase [Oscillospiraceae bacterium]